MAAARFAERYAAAGGRDEVVLCGAESSAPYGRVLLAEVLAGRLGPEGIALPVGDAVVRTGTEVVGLRPGAVVTADGAETRCDAVVLATGANPVLPPLRGLRRADGAPVEGVHSFRTLADCAALAAAARPGGRAVVVGGGVLGVSAARALAATGLAVEIVHQGPHLVERHLDARAGALLRAGLERLGVAAYPGARARALRVDGAGRVSGVELAVGPVLGTDLVVLACGVRPRTGLAHAAGLPVRGGVVVDEGLAVAPGVFAIGDCAEFAGRVHGLSGPAWEQADVLAARLSGADPHAVYTGSRPVARLTAGPIEYAVFGEARWEGAAGDAAGVDVVRLTDATRGTYKKLVLRGDRLVGGILLGDLATVGAVGRAYLRADPVAPGSVPAHLLHDTDEEGAA
ncbi:NAD(P)/FAD-dependent oxidoreductase [Streptomyces sp. BI20]|uniref:NAD(P)/FAD-dependent oxidoreductase n=1 Tax=Streptomyces sp. BI20 TaxID=3403460 RepID=UPI003C74A847